jgi:ATP-binding cassette subfamily B protein
LFPDRNVVSEPATQPLADPEPGRLHHTIEVRDLCFAYPDEPDRMVLDGISFTLRRGERLGIVGRSGEGKSTLIKILLGFYEPTSGEVLVDGHPADGAELATLHSYVPQDTSLFQETVEYNIGYASGGPVDHDAVRRAASRANIGEFIESLPDGYRTLVGERGIKLSLGQRQRIAIARAFLKQSDLVILDEATSALDSETEAKIRESLVELWQDRAAIVIAHRLATLNDMDRIMVIEHGRIAEQGTRDELIDADGRFADMWGLQRAGLN